ncbi:MAG: ATP-grasp domain-containing protein [Chloroflexi bacterium]|nr:ATP-grasp domain-containing protein [Chloroflexota bacterium]
MRSAGDGSRRVLVTDAGLGSAIAVIRSLGRRGWHVIAADDDPHSPGFRSRYATERLRYPPPDTDPDRAANLLLRAAKDRRVDLLIPVTDQVLLPLSAARSRVPAHCRIAMPDERGVATTHDKAATFELARSLGVPIPRTWAVDGVRDAHRAAAELGWPVVVKPTVSRSYRPDRPIESFAVDYASGPDELARLIRLFEARTAILLQEHLSGEAHGVELLMDRGRPLAAFQHRRLREVPVTGGASSFRESVALDPTLLGHATRLLGALEWTGLAMVEFKVTADGPRLMEVNGRIWGSLPLAVASGMDFPSKLADLLCGTGVGPGALDTRYRIGVRSRNMELEVVWIASVLSGRRRRPFLPFPGRREAVSAAAGLLARSDHFDVLSLEDPGPGLAEIAKIASKMGRKLIAGQ